VRQLLLAKPDSVYAVAPETGKLLWETPYNADNGSIIMTPVRIGDFLYVGGYQGKNLLLKLAADAAGVEVVWRNKPKQAISAVNVQPFVADGLVYGFHENGELRAMKVPEGDFAWKGGGPLGERPQGSGTAFLTKQGDRFFLFTESGDLVIAKLTPAGYEELSRAHLLEPTNNAFGRPVVWCAPAYADKSIVVRNDSEVIRVSLAE
jgi:outer membrane protein assembly factor BamB